MTRAVQQGKKKFTYGDYLTWPDEERWELIDGEAFDMTPAPSLDHQRVSGEIFRQLSNFLQVQNCEVFAAPFDVRLPEASEADEEISTVVQPDIAVICDPQKLDQRGCRGAPDFIVEIISPATAVRDQIQKVALYEKHGVKEYWLVHPSDRIVTIRLLGGDGRYGLPRIHEAKGMLAVTTLPGLEINLDEVFRRVKDWPEGPGNRQEATRAGSES